MFKLVALVVVAVIAVPAIGGVMERCDGSLDAAVEQVRACDPAAAALGADIGPSFVGLTCGSSESAGAFAQSSWETPLAGTAGRGTLHYGAEKRASGWRVLAASVTVGGRTISVVSCSESADPTGVSGDALACGGLVGLRGRLARRGHRRAGRRGAPRPSRELPPLR